MVKQITPKNKQSWGYHYMVDCSGCNDNISDKKQISIFVKELIKKIKMKAHGKPTIEYLLPGHKNEGYSMLQLIHTSNLAAHFMSKSKTAYFDVFSCKKFDTKIVDLTVKKYFAPKKTKSKFLTRQAP
jgi:S-adenosylmethionine/arginine decarboxylase-like enzyme